MGRGAVSMHRASLSRCATHSKQEESNEHIRRIPLLVLKDAPREENTASTASVHHGNTQLALCESGLRRHPEDNEVGLSEYSDLFLRLEMGEDAFGNLHVVRLDEIHDSPLLHRVRHTVEADGSNGASLFPKENAV